MSRYQVCVYAICKNEGKFVERWMTSMREADQVIVTDTGSTDDSAEKLRAQGAQVHVEKIVPWRFDVARNISLLQVPWDVDICVCTDLDEVFAPGWRKALESVWEDGAQRGRYLYHWSLKADGSPDVQFYYDKVHSRKGYRWRYPVHECLQYTGTLPEQHVLIPGMVLKHYPDTTKSRGTYLPLLELAVEEEPKDARMAYYLGREYMYAGRWELCIQTLKGYLALPGAVWKEERCAAMRWIAKGYDALEDVQQAYSWYFRAIAEMPAMRDAYVECALLAYRMSNWSLTLQMAETALKIEEKSYNFVNMGYAWDETPYDLAAIGAYWLGQKQRARDYAVAALQLAPNNARLQQNLTLMEQELRENEAE